MDSIFDKLIIDVPPRKFNTYRILTEEEKRERDRKAYDPKKAGMEVFWNTINKAKDLKLEQSRKVSALGFNPLMDLRYYGLVKYADHNGDRSAIGKYRVKSFKEPWQVYYYDFDTEEEAKHFWIWGEYLVEKKA